MTPEEVTHEVRRLEITTRHLVRDIMAGEYSSAFRGRGVEFAEVREYQPGDDIRTIDWNVTARLGSAYVKRFLEERELTILFLADVSASGAFGTRRQTKGELAVAGAAGVALAAARNNDRVGVAFGTDRIEQYVTPAKGRRQALRVISDLLSYRPRAAGTDLARALTELEPVLRRRAVIFILSDFLAAGFGPALARLARRHDVIGVQVADPRERELPDVGLVTLWDPESRAWLIVNTGDARVRQRFQERAERWDRELDRTFSEGGADLLRLETGEPYADALIAFFRRRERMLWR
jgi:uncharacterized protein (DUF58 family)